MSWFDVDRTGLAAILERRGKAFAVNELVQNAWDAGAHNVSIVLTPIDGAPQAMLIVEDDSAEGFVNLDESFTLFAKSRRAADPLKRGRFCLGEKLVIALCREASIISTTGGIRFDADGTRHRINQTRERGTRFVAVIRMTRSELAEVQTDIARLISPAGVDTIFNGAAILRPVLLATFQAKLPTELADADGNLRRSMRTATVEAFASDSSGEILELGIPVCAADWPWRLNVLQKVPLGMERDSVTDAFRRALQVAAVNALADTIDPEQAATPWASEAMGDSRATADAIQHLVTQRFGERPVIAVPGDPIANATAEATGCHVIHGGALSADAWANIRKHQLMPSTSQAFPTPKPSADAPTVKVCPLCKQPIRA